MILYDRIQTRLGWFAMAATSAGLCEVIFASKESDLSAAKDWLLSQPSMKPYIDQLKAYIDGQLQVFDLPLDPGGTDFQKKVWERLAAIPYGETRSYQDIAGETGNPAASRAVGMACGKNPLLIVIPCHRVIGKNGSLTGFGPGLELKKVLLDLERKK